MGTTHGTAKGTRDGEPTITNTIWEMFEYSRRLYTANLDLKEALCEVVYCTPRFQPHKIALKMYPSNQERKYCNEVDVLNKLRHRNVQRFVDCYKDPLGFYIACEACVGGNLCDLIINSDKWTERRVMSHVRTALRAVKHLHSKSIVHRNIKITNFQFTLREDPDTREMTLDRLTLTGFDRAMVVDAAKLYNEIDRVGTPYYMAPETIRNNERLGTSFFRVGRVVDRRVHLLVALWPTSLCGKIETEKPIRKKHGDI